MATKKQIYYLDRVRIIFEQRKEELSEILPLSKLNKCSLRFQFDDQSKVSKTYGYRSKIEATAPSVRFFELIDKLENLLRNKYKISYIEIAKDSLCTSMHESVILSDSISTHLRKKYTHQHFVYDELAHGNDNRKRTTRKINTEERKRLYADKTWYWGSNRVRLVVYPRISKIGDRPCFHMEWRIQGASNIKNKTQIETTKDILYFMRFKIKNWFEHQANKFLKYEKIDHEKHGRFIQNMHRGAKTSGYSYESKRKRFKKAEPVMASNIFCRINNIETAADLLKYYKDEIARIKNKGRGRRLLSDEKLIKRLTTYRLNSFFTTYDSQDSKK